MDEWIASLQSRVARHHGRPPRCPRPATMPHTTAAELMDQYEGRDGSWRVVVRYSTEPGSTYIRAEPTDRCQPLPEPQDDQPRDAEARGHEADGQDDPAGQLVAGNH